MSKKYFTSKGTGLLVIVILSSLLIFINPRGFFNPARLVFWELASPFQKTFYILGGKFKGIFVFLGSISDLKRENERLFKENIRLETQMASLKEEKRENEILREQLGLNPREKFNLEGSWVIGQDSQRSGSWIMIDKGNSSNIEDGMAVIVSDGILVGRVSEVFRNNARVNLLSNFSSSVNALDLETGSKGIIRGEFGLGLVMDMVDQNDVLNEGDTIATSGLGSNIPRGLLIGKVKEVKPTEDKLFQQALIAPSVRYSKLEVVFVIR